ncbi:MAG: AIR synthase-related protein [Candidatus Diapherotrites archaeon]|nr:AIR synthase-related protein [Candidatus Diapherotrites archaeon]
MVSRLQYASLVNYKKVNPVKQKALQNFQSTFAGLNQYKIKIVPESIGHTAAVLDFQSTDFMLAFNLEGLGTKSLIADQLAVSKTFSNNKNLLKKFYENLAIDCVASSINDLTAVGAKPLILADMIAFASNDLLNTSFRMDGLLAGFKKAALKYKFAIPCGETPVYPNLLMPHTIDLSAASLGIISPKKNFVSGKKLKKGDKIFGLASSGLHANGLSLARKISERLPKGYLTKLKNGKILAEELLNPSFIYSNLVSKLLDQKIDLHYMNPITGHGWQKIMRPKQNFTYRISNIPDKPLIFDFLQSQGKLSNEEAYKTWNMGLGFVLMAPKKEGKKIERIANREKIKFFELGIVEEGPKQVALEPLNLVFKKLF